MSYNLWDVVVIPFPFVDKLKSKPRPVLVLSTEVFAQENHHLIATMITYANHQPWAGDTPIEDLQAAGLQKRSIIRLKLFTLDLQLEPRKIGRLSRNDQQNFRRKQESYLL